MLELLILRQALAIVIITIIDILFLNLGKNTYVWNELPSDHLC